MNKKNNKNPINEKNYKKKFKNLIKNTIEEKTLKNLPNESNRNLGFDKEVVDKYLSDLEKQLKRKEPKNPNISVHRSPELSEIVVRPYYKKSALDQRSRNPNFKSRIEMSSEKQNPNIHFETLKSEAERDRIAKEKGNLVLLESIEQLSAEINHKLKQKGLRQFFPRKTLDNISNELKKVPDIKYEEIGGVKVVKRVIYRDYTSSDDIDEDFFEDKKISIITTSLREYDNWDVESAANKLQLLVYNFQIKYLVKIDSLDEKEIKKFLTYFSQLIVRKVNLESIPLEKISHIKTYLRSPHVHKKAKDQEIKTTYYTSFFLESEDVTDEILQTRLYAFSTINIKIEPCLIHVESEKNLEKGNTKQLSEYKIFDPIVEMTLYSQYLMEYYIHMIDASILKLEYKRVPNHIVRIQPIIEARREFELERLKEQNKLIGVDKLVGTNKQAAALIDSINAKIEAVAREREESIKNKKKINNINLENKYLSEDKLCLNFNDFFIRREDLEHFSIKHKNLIIVSLENLNIYDLVGRDDIIKTIRVTKKHRKIYINKIPYNNPYAPHRHDAPAIFPREYELLSLDRIEKENNLLKVPTKIGYGSYHDPAPFSGIDPREKRVRDVLMICKSSDKKIFDHLPEEEKQRILTFEANQIKSQARKLERNRKARDRARKKVKLVQQQKYEKMINNFRDILYNSKACIDLKDIVFLVGNAKKALKEIRKGRTKRQKEMRRLRSLERKKLKALKKKETKSN